MTHEELKALAKEHNEVLARGSAMYEEIEAMGKRIIEIRKIIDREAPGSYDTIGVQVFGAEMELYL